MECDYYDAPVFAETEEDWNTIRLRFVHCLLKKQLTP